MARQMGSRHGPQQPAAAADRVWTIPNGLSVARLLGVPLFLWLVLGPHADWWALAVLIVAGLTDWLDGKLARAWNQTSRIGRLLDPTADRLYIVAALAGLVARGIVPWWLVAVLVVRELFIVALYPVLRARGYGALPVHFLGKVATLCLLYAFPMLFVGDHHGLFPLIAKATGWAFALWGAALYWLAWVLYAVQTARLTRGGAPGVTQARSGHDEPRDASPVNGAAHKGATAQQ